MGRGTGRAARAARFGAPFFAAVAALALTLAGCSGDSQPLLMQAQLRGPSIAFESIDGPPVAVFQNLVTTLSAEAPSRQVQVVSRTGSPAYRVRGYLAAIVVGGKSHISWVWDVYDADKQRVLRIAGEEATSRPGSNAWAAADEQMVRRISRSSIDRLAAFLASPSAPPAVEPAVQPGSPAIASADAAAAALALAAPE